VTLLSGAEGVEAIATSYSDHFGYGDAAKLAADEEDAKSRQEATRQAADEEFERQRKVTEKRVYNFILKEDITQGRRYRKKRPMARLGTPGFSPARTH
jgi:hypothetical protein